MQQKDGALGQWVNTQRKNLAYRQKGLPSSLTQERIDQLDEIDFQWVLDVHTRWNKWFLELIAFEKQHGHLNVPRSHGALGTWVRNQRSQFVLRKNGEPSGMTDERTYDLCRIGFQWVGKTRSHGE